MRTLVKPNEVGRKAEAILQQSIRPRLAPGDLEKFVLIDVNTGAYEIGLDDMELEDRLLARHPDAEMVLLRGDGGPTGHFGCHGTIG